MAAGQRAARAKGGSPVTCRDAVALVADYLDLTLTPRARARLEAHVVLCAACRAYLATYRATRRLVATVGDVALPPDAEWRLRQVLGARWRRRPDFIQ